MSSARAWVAAADDGTGGASLSGEGFGMTGVHPN